MNKLKNELNWLKIQINSSYGINGISGKGVSLYDEFMKKKDKFRKIQDRVLKIKRILN